MGDSGATMHPGAGAFAAAVLSICHPHSTCLSSSPLLFFSHFSCLSSLPFLAPPTLIYENFVFSKSLTRL